MFKGDNYPDYLTFIEGEIKRKGFEEVLDEYIFKEDERVNIIFNRLFADKFLPSQSSGYDSDRA